MSNQDKRADPCAAAISLDGTVRLHPEFFVQLATALLVLLGNLPGDLSRAFRDRARDHLHAVTVRDDEVPGYHQRSADDDRTIIGFDLDPSRACAATDMPGINRDMFHDDLVGVAARPVRDNSSHPF